MKKDPICNMEVDERNAFTVECEGKTFYFCSEGCRERFMKGRICRIPRTFNKRYLQYSVLFLVMMDVDLMANDNNGLDVLCADLLLLPQALKKGRLPLSLMIS